MGQGKKVSLSLVWVKRPVRHAGKFLRDNNILGTEGGIRDTESVDQSKTDTLDLSRETM